LGFDILDIDPTDLPLSDTQHSGTAAAIGLDTVRVSVVQILNYPTD